MHYRFQSIFEFSSTFLRDQGVESSVSKIFSTASKTMFKASGGIYNIRAFQRTLNQGHVMRRKKRTQWKRSPSKLWGFYGFSNFQSIFEFSWISLHTDGVESSASKIFSTASKTMFKASGGFYNIRAFQRTLNQGHRMRRKKSTQWKRSPSKLQGFFEFSVLLMFFEIFFTLKVSS